MANRKKTVKEVKIAEDVLVLEKLVKKLIRTGFKDNTLDYTVQVAVSSLEPGVVKYSFMVSGLKKEIDLFAQSFYTFADCKKMLEGLIETIDPLEVEKTFHLGRINVYKHSIQSHEDRLAYLDEHGLDRDDEDIEMEEV